MASGCIIGISTGQAATPAPATTPSYAYEPVITGTSEIPGQMFDTLTETALSFRLKDTPPPSRASLSRRAEGDIERLIKVLKSGGYYDAAVTFEIIPPSDTEKRASLVFSIEPGTPYLIADVLVDDTGNGPKPIDDTRLERIGLHSGHPARASDILEAESVLTRLYHEDGYPHATIAKRRIRINPPEKTMTINFAVERGQKLAFGATGIHGLTSVTEKHVREFISWETGEPYDIRKVEKTQRLLESTGLFNLVTVQVADKPTAGVDQVAARIDLKERAHRSIGFGTRFSTSEGPAGDVFWEHRNLFNEGEKLRLGATASLIEKGVEANFVDPLRQDPRRSLLIESEIKSITSDAYNDNHAAVFAGIEQSLSRWWTGTLGPTVEYYDISSSEEFNGRVTLFGLRGNLAYDSTDNRLNPGKGARLRVGATPYTSFGEQNVSFLLSSVEASTYYAFDEEKRYVAAARTRLASTVGAERRAIPPSKRFYAGGGGSVRGFAFQTVGPLDEENEPIGGRSAAELGLELRLRVTDSIGIVPFLEGGNVYRDALPDFQKPEFLWGAGLGFRYYTEFGPIRLDIATPINKRDVVDKPVQFYISFGQAF